MDIFIQTIVSGTSSGSIYALLALGLVLLYRTTKILNFAHGEFGLLGTFIAYTLFKSLNLPFGLSFLLSLVAACIFGGLVSLFLLKPDKLALSLGLAVLFAALGYGLGLGLWWALALGLVLAVIFFFFMTLPNRNPSELALVILTLGLALALEGFDALAFGTDNKIVPKLIQDSTLRIGGAAISVVELFTLVLGVIIMVALWLLLNRSKIGLAMRAVAQKEDVAKAMGIPVRTVMFATWGASALLATAAACLLAPNTLLSPSMMLDPLSKAFVAAVIGGMNSLPGAILGGYILGILELFVGVYISNEFKASFAFLVVIIVLVFRPHGILGRPEVRRV